MTTPLQAFTSRCLLAIGVLGFGLLAGCSSSDDAGDAAVVTTVDDSNASSSTSSTRNLPAEPCSADTLGAATSSRYTDAVILDETCNPEAALATVESASVPGGEAVVVYFAGPDGKWLLAMTFPDAAALAAGAPPLLSRTLIQSWELKRDRRLNPQPPGPPRSTTTESTDPPASAPQGE